MKYINCKSYEKLINNTFDHKSNEVPRSGLIWVSMDQIAKFFDLIKYTKNEYAVVSSCSDNGLALQSEFPVENDMPKWFHFQETNGLEYNDLIVRARCFKERCKLSDKYSVRMYSFTYDTFDRVPDQVLHWYCTNSYLDHAFWQTKLPFGVADWAEPHLKWVPFKEKEKQIYVNFQNNTIERASLKRMFYGSVNPLYKLANNLSKEDYFNDLAHSSFVLCPCGNGWDGYRIWETLYMGSIPIVLKATWNDFMTDLPVVRLDRWEYLLDAGYVESLYNKYSVIMEEFDIENSIANLEYWEKKFDNLRM